VLGVNGLVQENGSWVVRPLTCTSAAFAIKVATRCKTAEIGAAGHSWNSKVCWKWVRWNQTPVTKK